MHDNEHNTWCTLNQLMSEEYHTQSANCSCICHWTKRREAYRERRRRELGAQIGQAMHEASQVGGPWTPCSGPYNDGECEHESMGLHVASLLPDSYYT